MRRNLKKYMMIVLLVIIICFISCFFDSSSTSSTVVMSQGNNLMISVDGVSATALPTSGTYYLTTYECDNRNTVVTWNTTTYELTVTNGTSGGGVSCDLTFESNPKLSSMQVGSYVAYRGSGGTVGSTSVSCQSDGSASSLTEDVGTEAPNSCLGQNAREDLDTSGYTYGYCYSSDYKYYVTGWRIAYILKGKVMLVSAGSPECNTRTGSDTNVTYINMANALALKYCNTDFVDGDCTCSDSDEDGLCDMASTDAWAMSDTDFYYMTKSISGYGKRLTVSSSSLGNIGGALGTTLYCASQYSYPECGYNNDLIDNGGYYWFAASDGLASANGVFWSPFKRYVDVESGTYAYGLRPVVRLSSSIFVTGGSGTMDDPYQIGN